MFKKSITTFTIKIIEEKTSKTKIKIDSSHEKVNLHIKRTEIAKASKENLITNKFFEFLTNKKQARTNKK